jgi:hypothetical protein
MRAVHFCVAALTLGLGGACTSAGDDDNEGSTSDIGTTTVDPPTGTSASTSASTTASTSTTTTSASTTMTSSADTTTTDDPSDTEPHDDCAFTESFDLPDGSDWPSYWTSVGGVAIADVQGGRGRLVPTPGAYAVARIITPLDCTDVEVTFAFELGDAGTQGFGMYTRQNGGYLQQTNPTGAGYSMFVEGFRAPAGVAVWREVDGVEQMIEPIVAADVASGVVYRARLRVTQQDAGTTLLQARFWPDTATEPGAWQVERTDSTPGLQGAGGNIAVDTYTTLMQGTAADMFVDDIVVAAAQ